MTQNEKRFWDILTNLFVGAEVKGKSGFINLMQAKQNYFKKVKASLLDEIGKVCANQNDFKDELYDKLYDFFHRYFSESGSIYYTYTPFFYKLYTKTYDNTNLSEIKTYDINYEQIITDRQDTALFYKTQMLYYVKSDRIFRELEIEIEGFRFAFDVSQMEGKKSNEKRALIYEFSHISENIITLKVFYKEGNNTTKTKEILKELKSQKFGVTEEQLQKAFRVFEKQSNIDYFTQLSHINPNSFLV